SFRRAADSDACRLQSDLVLASVVEFRGSLAHAAPPSQGGGLGALATTAALAAAAGLLAALVTGPGQVHGRTHAAPFSQPLCPVEPLQRRLDANGPARAVAQRGVEALHEARGVVGEGGGLLGIEAHDH